MVGTPGILSMREVDTQRSHPSHRPEDAIDDPHAVVCGGDSTNGVEWPESVPRMHGLHGVGSENGGPVHEIQRVQAWTLIRMKAAVRK